MKGSYPFLILAGLLLCLNSCRKESGFVLEGELGGLPSDMLLVVYDDPKSKTDTIFLQNGKFVYKTNPDTLNIFRIVNDSGEAIPVFANQEWRVSLKGDFRSYTIKGDGPNKELQEFRNQIAETNSMEEERKAAEAFIKSHPQSFVSAYLINQYFIQAEKPDEKKIRSLIQPLSGTVKDSRILNVALKAIPEEDEKKRSNNDEYVNYFSAKARNGKYISWNSSKKQYTLINFWATWDSESTARHDSLYNLVKKLKKDGLRVLNLSLDYDKKAWEKACKKDSEQWIEICDTKAWDNQTIKQMNFQKLPANVLVNANRKIQGVNLYGDSLLEKLEDLSNEKRK